MSTQEVENILARLYCDSDFRSQFLQEPDAILAVADLRESEREALRHIDRVGLEMASQSYQHKRRHQRTPPRTISIRMARWLMRAIRFSGLP